MGAQVTGKFEHLRLLVVDDQPEIRDLLCEGLRDMGVGNVVQAKDGKSALAALAQEGMIDLVVCDWNMPTMNGIDFLKEMRERHPGLPFLMMTARSDKESLIAAKDAGVTALLRKPFTPTQLEEKIISLTGDRP